jgi:DeoR family suf operon transcriptional repressor
VLRRQWAPLVEGAPDRLAALPLAERAQLVAEFRSSQGYMAEATVVAPGVARIREHHCALRDVAEQFPELCAAEQELLEELLGVPLERTCHIVTGCSSCAYVAREPAATASVAADSVPTAPDAGRVPDSTSVRPVPSPAPVTV